MTRIDEWSTPAEISRASFNQWADKAGLSQGARVLILQEAVELVAQERDDLLSLLERVGLELADHTPGSALVLEINAALSSPRTDLTKDEDR